LRRGHTEIDVIALPSAVGSPLSFRIRRRALLGTRARRKRWKL